MSKTQPVGWGHPPCFDLWERLYGKRLHLNEMADYRVWLWCENRSLYMKPAMRVWLFEKL